MSTNYKQLGFGLLFALFSICATAQSTIPTFFSSSLLETIMNTGACESVRFYNIINPNTGEVVTMAIGVNKDGGEISGLLFAKRYKAYNGVSGNQELHHALTKGQARAACAALKDTPSFSATFANTKLREIMSADGANGIRITQTKGEKSDTFTIESAMLKNGAFDPVPEGPSFVCGDPCPTFCGSSGNYLNR